MKSGHAIWAIAVIVATGTAGIVALAAVGDGQADILLPLLIGFLAPTVASLIGISKQDDTTKRLDSIDGRLNGELDARIEQAVERVLARWTSPPAK